MKGRHQVPRVNSVCVIHVPPPEAGRSEEGGQSPALNVLHHQVHYHHRPR